MTVDELMTELTHLQLLSESDGKRAETLQGELAGEDHAIMLTDQLIEEQLLSRYQVGRLLAGEGHSLALDRYVIQELIDEGGMGLVYKARHLSMDRIVAIKMLPEQLCQLPDRTARFEREIKLIAQLSHPNIVTAFDAHRVDGKFFLAMEYVEGQNLREVIAHNGPLLAEDACRLVNQISKALLEAHKKGIIHRDVKPSNILLTNSGDARLLDLGLAQFLYDAGTSDKSDLTDVGTPMGTINYMSPEQATNATSANELSDIYSLGCTLFFLITGNPPYQQNSVMQTFLDHREAALPQLSDHCDPGDLPNNLQHCLNRMLAKRPEDRFQSMAVVSQALDAIDQPGPHEPETTWTVVAADTVSKKRIWPKYSAWLAISLAIVIGLLVWRGANSKEEPTLSDVNSQRDVARWILNSGGLLSIETNMGQQIIDDVAGFPEGEFQVCEIDMPPVAQATSLVPIASFPHLRRLMFAGETAALYQLDELDNCKSLRILVLDGVPTATPAIQAIAKLDTLTDLILAHAKLTHKDIETISGMSNLKTLSLEGTEVPAEAFDEISKMVDLISLDVTNVFSNDSSVLERISRLRGLKALYLGGTDVRDEQLKFIAKLTHLNFLCLDYCEKVTARGLGHLTEIPGLSGLQIEQTAIDDDGLKNLVRNFPDLQLLDIAGTNVSATTLPLLGNLDSLYQLSLAGLKIGNRDIEALLEIPHLQILDLSGTDITDRSLQALEPLQLELLTIVGCQISEKAILNYPYSLVFESGDSIWE